MRGRPKLVPEETPVEFGCGARERGLVYVTSDKKRWKWDPCKSCDDVIPKYVNLGSQALCNACLKLRRAQQRAQKAHEGLGGA